MCGSYDEVYEKLLAASDIFKNRQFYFTMASRLQQEADLEICDIYHYIELIGPTPENSFKLCEALKASLEKRRQAKDLLSVLEFIQPCNTCKKGTVIEKVSAFADLDSRFYTIRTNVLSEIFDQESLSQKNTFSKEEQNS